MMHNNSGVGVMHGNQRHHRLDGMHRDNGPVDNGGDDLDGCRMMHNVAGEREKERERGKW